MYDMMSRNSKRIYITSVAVLLVSAACLYASFLSLIPIGYVIDDALYILAGKSLLHGHYLALTLPTPTALTDPLPGFPLFLAPFIVFLEPHWALLKILPLSLTLANGGMLYKLFCQRLGSVSAALLVAFFLFNPMVVSLSTVLVSEQLFLFVSLLLFDMWTTERFSEQIAWRVVFGMLLGWSMIIRPQGIALFIAFTAAIIVRKRWRMIPSLLIGLLIWGCVWLRNVSIPGNSGGYLQHWTSIGSSATRVAAIKSHAAEWILRYLTEGEMSLPTTGHPIWMLWIQGAAVALFLWGVWSIWQSRKTWSPPCIELSIPLFVFTFSYIAIHLFWVAIDIRYFYPILPWGALVLGVGIKSLRDWTGKKQRWDLAVLLLLFSRFVYADIQLRREGRVIPLPLQTYHWIKQNLPPTSFVFTPAAATLRLYTECFAMFDLAFPSDIDDFRFGLLEKGISHVMVQPTRLVAFRVYKGETLPSQRRWEQISERLASATTQFSLIYQNPIEQTALLTVNKDLDFVEAYKLYLEAMKEVTLRNNPVKQMMLLRNAIQKYPRFARAWAAYGVALFLSGNTGEETYHALQRAVALDPNNASTWLNLGRLEARRGRVHEARLAFDHADKCIYSSGRQSSLIPHIQAARTALLVSTTAK